jgi:hypothetical protein
MLFKLFPNVRRAFPVCAARGSLKRICVPRLRKTVWYSVFKGFLFAQAAQGSSGFHFF